ncbi:MAG: hypothetical protein ACTSRU_18130, partial [Candidatus Hodarchaeales archaeon]
ITTPLKKPRDLYRTLFTRFFLFSRTAILTNFKNVINKEYSCGIFMMNILQDNEKRDGNT